MHINSILGVSTGKGNIEAYIIDVAGTITNGRTFIEGRRESFEQHAYDYYVRHGYSEEQAKKNVEFGREKRNQDPPDEKYLHMLDEVNAELFEQGKIQLDVFDDVPKAFKEMKESGAKVAVYSAGLKKSLKPSFKTVKLDGGKTLDSYVDGYFSSFDVGKKDNPESYRKIASQLGVDITNSVYVDDQAKYVKTAKKAGFRKVYRRASPEQPEGQNEEHDEGYETINSLSEVVENKVPVQVSDEASHMHASHEAQAENQLSEDAGAEGEGDKVETAVEAE